MKTITTPATLALLLGLVLTACAQSEPAGGPGSMGTAQQPTASPDEVQDEEPQAQQPGSPVQ